MKGAPLFAWEGDRLWRLPSRMSPVKTTKCGETRPGHIGEVHPQNSDRATKKKHCKSNIIVHHTKMMMHCSCLSFWVPPNTRPCFHTTSCSDGTRCIPQCTASQTSNHPHVAGCWAVVSLVVVYEMAITHCKMQLLMLNCQESQWLTETSNIPNA